MTHAELEALMMLTTFFGGGTFLLIGLKMFFNYRARRITTGAGSEEVRQLRETVEDLRRDVADTRADLVDVNERIDFAERLLTRGRGEPGA